MITREMIIIMENLLNKGNEIIIKRNKENEIKIFKLEYSKKFPIKVDKKI